MSGKIQQLVDEMEKMMTSSGKIMEEMNRSGKGELFVLKYLYMKNGSATPSELSEALSSSTARISTTLGALEKKGQVRREIDLSNRRFIVVNITEDGKERIRHILEQMRGDLVQILSEMGEADAAEFIRLSAIFFEKAKHTMLYTIQSEVKK